MEYKDGATNQAIKDHRTTDLSEKEGINNDIKTLDKKCDDFRANYDNFTHEATKLDEPAASETFSGCMDIVLATKGAKEIPEGNLVKPEHIGIQ